MLVCKWCRIKVLCRWKEGINILNQVVLVGRIVKDPELHEAENGNKLTYITIAVPRPFKNVNGEYDTDFISCSVWKGVAENVCEYCKKGDLVGVRGRIETYKDEENHQVMDIVADKITFLQTGKSKEAEA